MVAENLNDLLFPLKASERAAKRMCSENLAKCAALKMAVLAQQMAALPHEAFWPPSMPVFVKQIESSLLVSSICLAAVVDTNQSSFWPTPDASVKNVPKVWAMEICDSPYMFRNSRPKNNRFCLIFMTDGFYQIFG